MSDKSKVRLMPLFLSAAGVLLVGGVIFYFSSPLDKAEAGISLQHKDRDSVELGKAIYAENCASCHGVVLEGQANWRQRDTEGYLPAPPHDERGHTWHHPASYVFLMGKYGIEESVIKFRSDCMRSALPENAELFSCPSKVAEWAFLQNFDAVLMAQAPVGICNDVISDLESSLVIRGVKIIKRRHWWDAHFYPAARAGFFNFKKSIPTAIEKLTKTYATL